MPLRPGQAAHHRQQAGAIQRLFQRPEQLAFVLRLDEKHAAGIQSDRFQSLAARQPPAARGPAGLDPDQAPLRRAGQVRGAAQNQRQRRRPVSAPLSQELVNAGPFQPRKRPAPPCHGSSPTACSLQSHSRFISERSWEAGELSFFTRCSQ